MGINLWIIYYDLSIWHPGRSRLGDVRTNILEYFAYYRQEEIPDSSCLYLIESSELADAYRRNPNVAYLCIGEPGRAFADMEADIVWVSSGVPREQLISSLSACFHRYQAWHCAMMDGIRVRKPLKFFTNLSLPIFRQPVSLFSSNFMSLCFSYNEALYGPLPRDYSVFNAGSYISEDIMQDIEVGGLLDDSLAEKAPYLYVTHDGFRCLCSNIWVMGRNIAILEVDEINSALSERDRALIYILSQVLQDALETNNMINFSLQSEFKEEILGLLEGRSIPRAVLCEGLKGLNWNLEDRYSCLVFQSLQRHAHENALWVNGETLIHILPSSVYVIHQNNIILICNRSLFSVSQYKKALRGIRDKLVNINMVGGVSTEFMGLDKLHHFVKCSRQAIEIGLAKRPGQYLYYFQELSLDIISRNCLSSLSPEVFIPSELLDVMEYDRKKDSDYCKVLFSLLKNNMSPTAAAAELYMHRNTIINRLGQLKTKFNMDLDDYSYRLQLMMAFYFIHQDIINV